MVFSFIFSYSENFFAVLFFFWRQGAARATLEPFVDVPWGAVPVGHRAGPPIHAEGPTVFSNSKGSCTRGGWVPCLDKPVLAQGGGGGGIYTYLEYAYSSTQRIRRYVVLKCHK